MPPVPVKLSAARPPGSVAPPAAAKTTITRPRILAVDDTPEALRQLRDCLKALNAECFTCGSGASAVEFLSKELVDVAIVDVSMPGMDGFEVCRAIKHEPRTANIPVILVTGDLKSEDTHRGVELGAFDYLTKPVDPHECNVRIHAALQVKKLLEELHTQLMAPDEQRRVQNELQEKMLAFQHGMTTAHWQKRFGQLSVSFLDDIQSPLAGALASLQVLMVDDQLRDDVRRRLIIMHGQFRQVNDHLRRLLNVAVYSRSPHLIHPAEIVSDLTRLLEPEFLYYGIHLEQELDPTVEWWGMRSEISRAVLYLLHNAIEAHSEKPPVIRTRFEDEDEPEQTPEDPHKIPTIRVVVESTDAHVAIRISDNAKGIPEALHEKIWDPYFTTKRPPHTGAGLHLVRGIARAGGGDVKLQSPGPECSTQFSILLPINTAHLYPTEEEIPAAEPAAYEEAPAAAEE